jgi:hypothetical protein
LKTLGPIGPRAVGERVKRGRVSKNHHIRRWEVKLNAAGVEKNFWRMKIGV